MTAYDVIGDIHGHADALIRLLMKLGYREERGVYRHESRTVIFLGDFVDRGPQQREVLRIARTMVKAGAARAVMGNHEFNAIGFATKDDQGRYLRPHSDKNRNQHCAFLDQIGEGSKDHEEAVAWFKTLPLWLDLGGLRVIHACWNAPAQQALAGWLDAENRLTREGMIETQRRGSVAYGAAEVLLKGPEARLPRGWHFHDKDGHRREEVRLRWWDPKATTFKSAALGMDGQEENLPDDPVSEKYFYRDARPVLFGHYWMTGQPKILASRASCLDFSVAKGGYLTAYSWSGERLLDTKRLNSVQA